MFDFETKNGGTRIFGERVRMATRPGGHRQRLRSVFGMDAFLREPQGEGLNADVDLKRFYDEDGV